MKDEQGNSVHASSAAAYAALVRLRSPSRGWWAVAVLLAVAMLCSAAVYVANVARDMYFAHVCAEVKDTWTGRECKPREETPPPAQHYTLELPPIIPEHTPAPAPSGQEL